MRLELFRGKEDTMASQPLPSSVMAEFECEIG